MRTADRKINEWLFLEELFVWSEDKRNPTICINQKPQEKIDAEFGGEGKKINIPWLEAKHYYFQSGEESFK